MKQKLSTMRKIWATIGKTRGEQETPGLVTVAKAFKGEREPKTNRLTANSVTHEEAMRIALLAPGGAIVFQNTHSMDTRVCHVYARHSDPNPRFRLVN